MSKEFQEFLEEGLSCLRRNKKHLKKKLESYHKEGVFVRAAKDSYLETHFRYHPTVCLCLGAPCLTPTAS